MSNLALRIGVRSRARLSFSCFWPKARMRMRTLTDLAHMTTSHIRSLCGDDVEARSGNGVRGGGSALHPRSRRLSLRGNVIVSVGALVECSKIRHLFWTPFA